jgi:predicted  nucleic acid-binding Zn-ribbon protein
MSNAQQLYHLQELDIEIEADRQSLRNMKGQLGESAAMAKARADLAAEQKLIADLKKQQQGFEWEAEDITTKLKKSEEELYSGRIRNPKELSSLQQDIAMLKANRSKIDDKDLELMESLEKNNTKYTGLSEQLKKTEAQWQIAQQQLTADIEKTGAKLVKCEQDRQSLTSSLDASILALYEDLKKKRKTAVAKVTQGICSGCHIQLPGTDLQKVRSGSVVQCSSCGRILFQA